MWNLLLSLFRHKEEKPLSSNAFLPTEVWMIIFEYCSVSDLLSFWSVSKFFYFQLFSTELFWKLRIEKVKTKHQDLFSYFFQNKNLHFSNFEQCLLIDIAIHSSTNLSVTHNNIFTCVPSVAFIGGEMSQRNYLVQELSSKKVSKQSNMTIQSVIYHSKHFHFKCFSYEVYQAKYDPYAKVFQHQTIVVIFFDAFDPHNQLQQISTVNGSTWKWDGEIGQGMELVQFAKQLAIPFIFLIGCKATPMQTQISTPTVKEQQVSELCKEYGIYYYYLNPEKKYNLYLYTHNQQQVNQFKGLLTSVLVYSTKIKKN